MSNPRVNKWLDMLDRAGWTAIQAAAGAVLVITTSEGAVGWEEFLKFVAGATLVAVVKVIVGQNTGADDTGSLIGTAVIEPPPVSPE